MNYDFDGPSFVIASVAALISLAAWWENRRSRKAAEQSRDAAETSAGAAQQSAAASEVSAKAAARLTDIEADRRRDEREQYHRDLAPSHPGEIVTGLMTSEVTQQFGLFGSISVGRDYRVQVIGIAGNTCTPITGVPPVLRANTLYQFHIEQWPDEKTTPTVKEIEFRFWPPAPVDEVEAWTCPCGRLATQADNPAGHWAFRAVVKSPPPPPFAFYS
ncbi:hypothetical protein [Sphaerisporangium sp. TRM90804]|uniref:hypothetical protein n=1 Tax=Sphaerisporangium sp. TRM90804 TaxID=3031113 RepID=UPI00244CE672|nr:hypothetical protein [Sphaerisporangium sp. TRM90804]MDH2424776.1 hypothetical protein [Sphaerisporangium sp. TRM90804]